MSDKGIVYGYLIRAELWLTEEVAVADKLSRSHLSAQRHWLPAALRVQDATRQKSVNARHAGNQEKRK